ncbi:MAG: metal ABC transporter permease [Muribaculaceae bacterium]|nr:metal ABC transporter permease [Muribaculaceae bacterium]
MFDLLQYSFFTNALMGIVIISIAAAFIGTYIITRRLVSISGGITHACFGGLGLGYYLGVNPIFMASVFAIGASAGVEWMSERYRVREDSATAVVWALGMAIGVLFIFLTPGYVPELNAFLFGNILTISSADLWAFAIYTLILLVFFAIFYDKIIACAFDRDFARVSHLPVKFISYVMTAMVAVCIVLTIRLVGIMLLMSMLTLPQMIAEMFAPRFKMMVLLSMLISIVCGVVGLFISAIINVPCAAIIVILFAVVFVVGKIVASFR